jgi:plasmid stability protein
MATLTVRKLNDTTYQNLGKRAKANNRSLEAEARDILDREASETKAFDIKEWVAEVREIQKRNPLKLPDGKTSLDLLREERDSW